MNRIFSVAFLLSLIGNSYSQIVINEYSGAKLNSTADNSGGFEDWIELYNTGGSDVNITGRYLSSWRNVNSYDLSI